MSRLLEGSDALNCLREQWPQLYGQDETATPYQSPTWLAAWAAQLPATSVPLVLLAEDWRGRPLAALALARHRRPGRRAVIEPLSSPASEYIRPVGPYTQAPAVAADLAHGLTELAGNCDVVMRDVPSHSGLARHMGALREWQHHSPTQCATVPLPVAYATMNRDRRRAHERRRAAWTQLAQTGAHVTYRRTRTTGDLLHAWEQVTALHERRWSEATDYQPPPAGLSAVLAHCGAGLAFVATLAVAGRPLAAQLCLYRGDRCYSMITGMDSSHEWLPLAPGHALIRYLCADLGGDAHMNALDLGRTIPTRGQYTYKAQYSPLWHTTLNFSRTEPDESGARPPLNGHSAAAADEEQATPAAPKGAA